MVFSNSGLSLFDHPVNRENRNVVVNLLQDLTQHITAIFLVARPIARERTGKFEHWAVKIQARGCLISIDFLDNKGKGAFGLQQRTDAGAELDEFMYYSVYDPATGRKTRHKWEIISSVTPHPLSDPSYLRYLSEHDRAKLHADMKQFVTTLHARKHKGGMSRFKGDIAVDRRVCDVANFCRFFTADGRGYNAITKNCQQFAAELYASLIGNNYREESERVFRRYQGPYDKRQWKKGTNLSAKISAAQKSSRVSEKPKNKSERKPVVDATSSAREKKDLQTDKLQLFDDLNRSNSTDSMQ